MADDAPGTAPKDKAAKPNLDTTALLKEKILKAICAIPGRKGLSYDALKKALVAEGYDVAKNKFKIKRSVQTLLNNGEIVQVKGTGMSGSYKATEKTKKEMVKAAKREMRMAKKKSAASKK